MKKENQLLLEAIERVDNGIEPTGEDWWLFRRIYNMSRAVLIFSKRKRMLYELLLEHLVNHNHFEMNEEEIFTLRFIIRMSNGGRQVLECLKFLMLCLLVLLIYISVQLLILLS